MTFLHSPPFKLSSIKNCRLRHSIWYVFKGWNSEPMCYSRGVRLKQFVHKLPGRFFVYHLLSSCLVFLASGFYFSSNDRLGVSDHDLTDLSQLDPLPNQENKIFYSYFLLGFSVVNHKLIGITINSRSLLLKQSLTDPSQAVTTLYHL